MYLYMHISPTGKKYVGITKQNPEDRWRNGKGYERNEYFFRAILKYGWDNFQHIVLFSDLSEDEANKLEEKIIKELDLTNPKNGYNLHSGGLHHETSESTRAKISNSRKGRFTGAENPFYGKKHSEEALLKMRKRIECYSADGEYIRTFDSLTEASELMNADRSGLAKSCKKDNCLYCGYQWKYEDGNKKIQKLVRKPWNARKVIMIDKDTKNAIKVFGSLSEAGMEFGENARCCIGDCCRGVQKTAYGYIWKYE